MKKHNSMELELTMTFFALAFAIIIFFDRQKNSCQDNIKKTLVLFPLNAKNKENNDGDTKKARNLRDFLYSIIEHVCSLMLCYTISKILLHHQLMKMFSYLFTNEF